MCVLQAHISHPLPCLQYKTMLSHEDDKQRVRRVCKNVSVRTFSTIIHLIKLESFQGRKRWHLSHAVWGSTYWKTLRRVTQQKVLAQDSWARWPRSCPRGQDLAQEAKILSRRPNLAQNLAQDLRQDPGQDFGCHNLGILDKILGKSWARGGKSWPSLGQVLGKISCARTFCWEMFGCVYSKHTLVIHYLAFNTRQCFLMRMINSV